MAVLCCSAAVSAIFSIRWGNCLPGSGFMPLMRDGDSIAFFSKYLFYARESFGYPIGLLDGVGFPFRNASLSGGSIPLGGILFKLLSRIDSTFLDFFYYPFLEIVSVFLTAVFTILILKSAGIQTFWWRFLGAILVGLCPALLFRSSEYYGVTFAVMNFPIYLTAAYFVIQICRTHSWPYAFALALLFPLSALTEPYVLFALGFMGAVLLGVLILFELLHGNHAQGTRSIVLLLSSIVCGLFLSFATRQALGDNALLVSGASASVLEGRYSTTSGYGGGWGGGFHAADLLTFFIPPKDAGAHPPFYGQGPTAFPVQFGFPLSTGRLQEGQFEGFAYLGTIVIGILFILILVRLLEVARDPRATVSSLGLRLRVAFQFKSGIGAGRILGIASFALFVLSLGYIVHVAGTRLNDLPTPGLILTMLWQTLIYMRSLGRLDLAFMLFVTFVILVRSGLRLETWVLHGNTKWRPIAFALVCLAAGTVHFIEIRGYLVQAPVTRGNDIANQFNAADVAVIHSSTGGKKAVIIYPSLRGGSLAWFKTSYALGFHANIPISGAPVGLGIPLEHNAVYQKDSETIAAGDVKSIFRKYGDVAIAASQADAQVIQLKSNVPLRSFPLSSQNAVILTSISSASLPGQ